MLTNADARHAVITAIEANGTDVAAADEYDLDAIVHAIHEATGAYDVEAMDPAAFWEIVERHERPASRFTFRALLTTRPNGPVPEFELVMNDREAGRPVWTEYLHVDFGPQHTDSPYIMSEPPTGADLTVSLQMRGWKVLGEWGTHPGCRFADVEPTTAARPTVNLPAIFFMKL